MGFAGYDSVPGTSDDRLHTAKLCSGTACAVDADCGDAGATCVPDVDPADAGFNLALRCRPAHATGFLAATTA